MFQSYLSYQTLTSSVQSQHLAAVTAQAAAPLDLAPLQTELQAYLSSKTGTYGLYLVDLATGAEMGILADHLFPSASTYKLPMVMYILNEIGQGRASFDEQITYTEQYWQDGTGLLQDVVMEGDTASVGLLIELSIIQSDNVAAEMLRGRFGSAAMFDYLRGLGGSQFYYDPETYGATPREMAGYLRALYRGEAIADPTLEAYLMDLLTRTAWHDRIDAGVPDGIPVAHKIGTLDGVINDAALVLLPGRPYVLVFYTEGIQSEDALQVSAEVSRRVYEYLTAQTGVGAA